MRVRADDEVSTSAMMMMLQKIIQIRDFFWSRSPIQILLWMNIIEFHAKEGSLHLERTSQLAELALSLALPLQASCVLVLVFRFAVSILARGRKAAEGYSPPKRKALDPPQGLNLLRRGWGDCGRCPWASHMDQLCRGRQTARGRM